MSVVGCLVEMGGVALRRDLVRRTSRAAVDAALQAEDVVVVARGRYALPTAEQSLVHAHRLSGVVSHLRAALIRGWEVTVAPDLSHVTVARHRTPTSEQRRGVLVHWADLGPDDVCDRVTRPTGPCWTACACLTSRPRSRSPTPRCGTASRRRGCR